MRLKYWNSIHPHIASTFLTLYKIEIKYLIIIYSLDGVANIYH